MTISEKTAHLKGLIEGLALDADKKETTVINAIVDILDDIALDLADVQEEQAVMADYIDELDYDLGEVEEILLDEDEEDDEDEDLLEAECPNCQETFYFEADTDPENIVCPFCGGHFTCVCQCDDEEADCQLCVNMKEDTAQN